MKRLILIIPIIILVVTLSILAVLWWVNGEHLRRLAEETLSSATGKTVHIGTLALDKGWTTGILIDDLVLESDGEPAAGNELTARHVEIRFRILSLLEERLDFPGIAIDGLALATVRDGDGNLLWAGDGLGQGNEEAAEDHGSILTVGNISLRDGSLVHSDMASGRTDRLTGLEVDGELRVGRDARIAGRAGFNGSPSTFVLEGGPFDGLVSSDKPYPVRLALDGPARLRIEGTLVTTDLGETRLTSIHLSGNDFSTLGAPFGIPFPSTPPYDLRGTLTFGPHSVTLAGFEGRIGDSDAAGDLTLDLAGKKPALMGAIRSRRLDFDDLAGLLGAEPELDRAASGEQARDEQDAATMPDGEIPVGLFRGANLDVRLQAASVIAPTMKIDDIDARFRLEDGRLLVKPLVAGIADGRLEGEVAVNVRDDIPSADADLALEALNLMRFFEDSDFVEEMGGRMSGRLYLIGSGRNLESILADARGGGHLVLRDGRISGLVVEAAGLDVVESLGLLVGGDVRIPMPCAVAAVSADRGLLRIDRGTIFTEDSLLVARGSVDLDAKTLDLQVEALERDFSLIDLTAPVSLSGPVADPTVSIGGFDPFPFFSMPEEEAQVDCDWLITDARAAAPGKPVN
jgi:hypothetical protein